MEPGEVRKECHCEVKSLRLLSQPGCPDIFENRALCSEFYVYDVNTSWWRPITTWMDHQAIHATFIDGASYGVIE